MSMEKNGNTLAPGDAVRFRNSDAKLASQGGWTVASVDPETSRVQLKHANSGEVTFVDLHELERA